VSVVVDRLVPDRGGGFVCFVGAGPGADDLITLRGLRRLRAADVVIHDRLVSRALLWHARHGAEVIDVGRDPGHHGRDQGQVNALIVERAHRGRRVVRLKGGDPTVFGRLAEEIRAVRAAGLRFEIVPGVTAATAAAALAGVSLTERGVASAVVLATGTEHCAQGIAALDWCSLARLEGTLILYMAVRHLEDIVSALRAFGRDPDEPAVIAERIGTADERVIAAPLYAIAEAAREADIASPAVLVIGPTVAPATSRASTPRESSGHAMRVLSPGAGEGGFAPSPGTPHRAGVARSAVPLARPGRHPTR